MDALLAELEVQEEVQAELGNLKVEEKLDLVFQQWRSKLNQERAVEEQYCMEKLHLQEKRDDELSQAHKTKQS